MARTTFVKAAQPRFAMVPKRDDKGMQITVPVLRRDGTPKTTKTGRAIVRQLTVADKTRPLANRTCEKCGKEITVGSPYKHISPKSGPYGGRMLVRCGDCPTWNVWDYSSSLPSQIARISHQFGEALMAAEDVSDVEAARDEAADEIEGLGDEREESAQNMEDGFGHETEPSADLRQQGEDLKAWAEEIRSTDVPELPDADEAECEDCEGTGRITPDEDDLDAERDDKGEVECEACHGTGHPEEVTEEQIETWRDEVSSALSIIDECPV